MSNCFTIKQNDTNPPITTVLKQSGLPVSLTGTTIKFIMSNLDTGVVAVEETATAAPDQVADKGQVSYEWMSGDTAIAGTYKAEWEVTFADGGITTFPSKSYNIVEIEEDLA